MKKTNYFYFLVSALLLLFVGCETFDSETDDLSVDKELSWTLATPKASFGGRIDFGSAVFNEKLWVIGGLYSYIDSNDHFQWSSRKDVWSSSDGVNWDKVSTLPREMEGPVVVFKDKLWIMGENLSEDNLGNPIKLSDIYNSEDGVTWNQVSSGSWVGRVRHVMLVFNNKLWVLGGTSFFRTPQNPPQYYNDVWYSEDGETWVRAVENASWEARSRFAGVVFNEKMWIFGGEGFTNVKDKTYNDMWSSQDGVSWTKEKTFSYEWHDEGSSALKAVVHNDKVWLILGWGGGEIPVIYSEDMKTWYGANADQPWTQRGSHALELFNNRLWIFGGSSENDYSRDVWYSQELSTY